MEKLKQVIYYILKKTPNGRTRVDLSKLVYYSDTVFFQRHASTITDQKYFHLEDCPMAHDFYPALNALINEGILEVRLQVADGKIGAFSLIVKSDWPVSLEKEEKRIINKVVLAFPVKVVDENRQYPNLYESYVITPIFSEIPIKPESINTKIHFHKKKSLLSLSGKIFRVLYEE
jgi:hypothetical protein